MVGHLVGPVGFQVIVQDMLFALRSSLFAIRSPLSATSSPASLTSASWSAGNKDTPFPEKSKQAGRVP